MGEPLGAHRGLTRASLSPVPFVPLPQVPAAVCTQQSATACNPNSPKGQGADGVSDGAVRSADK